MSTVTRAMGEAARVRDDRGIASACALVARFGAAAVLIVRARIDAALDAMADARYRTLYGTGRGKPVGLMSGG